jgi:Ca2+-transporting ATPase
LASNIGEILILFIASLVGIPLPLLAIHLLWINLITDGLPAIALGIDPINPNVMKRQPRSIHQSIIGSQMIITIIILSSLMTI